jgi:hypothetical protein
MSVAAVILHSKTQFIKEQTQGSLEINTIIGIAINLAQKIQKINGLSGPDKKALLLLLLKLGMDDCGFHYSFDILKTASLVVDSIILASNGGFKKPQFWDNGFPFCLTSVDAISPKEQKFLNDATLLSNRLFDKEINCDPSD